MLKEETMEIKKSFDREEVVRFEKELIKEAKKVNDGK